MLLQLELRADELGGCTEGSAEEAQLRDISVAITTYEAARGRP